MRKISRFSYFFPSLCAAALLSACASKPVEAPPSTMPKQLSGDVMLRESQGMAQLSSRWQEGKQMVEKGQTMQRHGQTEIDQGQTLIDEGQKVMRESEEGYKKLSQ